MDVSKTNKLPVVPAVEQQADTLGESDGYNHDVESRRLGEDHRPTTLSVSEDDSLSQPSIDSSGGTHDRDENPTVTPISTNVSLGPNNPVQHYTSYVEVPDSVYDKIPRHRKIIIVALLSFCSLLAPVSSTTVLSATPEVAAEYHTTGSIVDLSNALYTLFMGISPIVWGPFSEVWGRRSITCTTALLFSGCSIGTALAPNLASFFVFRILTASEGAALLLVGSACLQDIYRPTERATAIGWFMSGTLIGPALGPFIGSFIVTYTSWRLIFWVQFGLSSLATLGTFFLLPETIHHRKYDDLVGMNWRKKARVLWDLVNPWRILILFATYPNLVLVGIASSSLVWNIYSILTPIRYVLNPRFHLTSPMQSGLFCLAPGAGYLLGNLFGGRYADHIVKKYIVKSGTRVPEDRMRSALPFLGIVIPACILIYGWSVEKAVGGITLAVVTLFLQGVAQLFCFPSLNTYCLDVMQGRGSDVMAGNYFVRYLFAFMGTAVVLPAVESIGVGWYSTISAFFMISSALGVWATVTWGRCWRETVDRGQRAAARDSGAASGDKEDEANVKRSEGRDIEAGVLHGSGLLDHDEAFTDAHSDPEKEEVEVLAPDPSDLSSGHKMAVGRGHAWAGQSPTAETNLESRQIGHFTPVAPSAHGKRTSLLAPDVS